MSIRKVALFGLAAFLATSCSATVAPPPAAHSPTSTSKPAAPANVAPRPAPETSPLAKEWKSYGGTAYFGCPEEFSVSKSALEDIRPKAFDSKTGQFASPAIPTVPEGEKITGGMCALSNTVDDMKVVYVITTSIPARKTEPPQLAAPEATKTTAYLFDLKSTQPLTVKDLQAPTPDLMLTAANQWRLAATRTGVAWLNAFTDGHATTATPRTVILSNTDLSMAWNDPQAGQVWQDVLAFQRNTVGKTSGAELRVPTGEPVFQDNDIATVDTELSEGPDKLVKLTRRDAISQVASTMFYDLNSRSIIRIGDSDRVSGAGLTATLSDGKLFIDGHGSTDSQFGFGVWNLHSRQWDLLKTRDEANTMAIAKLTFFGDRLYVTYAAGTLSVIALPAANPVASTWSVRPFARISGWTLVCRGETAGATGAVGAACKEILLVADQDGHYPGPWA
jgi:hypothetical protein